MKLGRIKEPMAENDIYDNQRKYEVFIERLPIVARTDEASKLLKELMRYGK